MSFVFGEGETEVAFSRLQFRTLPEFEGRVTRPLGRALEKVEAHPSQMRNLLAMAFTVKTSNFVCDLCYATPEQEMFCCCSGESLLVGCMHHMMNHPETMTVRLGVGWAGSFSL
jgi:hypothetical protein